MGAISTCEASSQAPDGVLIVEDEPLVALFLKDVVEESGWRVDAIAPSCKEALDQAEKYNIQLAFVDVRLKGADDGIATALQLVDRYGIKVIFMSGNPDLSGDDRVDVIRPLAILAKPCSPQRIEQVLEQVRRDA